MDEDASATSINSLLDVVDPDSSQTLTWAVTTSPTKGSLGGFSTTASTAGNSTPITPSGLTYTPTANQNGSDSFVIEVSDGTATDSITVNVTINAVNDAPTDIALSSSSINQSAATAGATIGTLSSTDVDSSSFTYTLVAGSGDTNNASFSISGSSLKVGGGALAAGSYSVRIQTDDGSSGTYAKAFTITVADDVGPSISSVTGPSDGTYTTGQNLDVTVNYNEAVIVNTTGGTPYIVLTIGSTARNASCTSGSGTTALVFRYTVQSSDTDTDGIAVATSITLNGGTIKDAASNDAATSFTAPTTTGVLVIPPSAVTSIARKEPGPVVTGTSAIYRVTFDHTVTGVTTDDFQLTTNGTASGSIASVSAVSGSVYDVTVNTLAGRGMVRLDLKSGTDISGSPSAFTFGQSYSRAPDIVPTAWGQNDSGQLGNDSTTQSNIPVAVDTSGVLSGKTVVAMALGRSHSLALTSDGAVYSWGSNSSGQLGNNSTTQSNIPVAVDTSGVLSGKTIVAIAAGSGHSMALASDGTAYAWGSNSSGQLGNNSTTQSNVPVAVYTSGVLSGKTIAAIAAGGSHGMALTSDGTVYTWGSSSFGQLGNNSTTQSTVPVAVNTSGVLSGKTVVAIAAGYSHSIALASDGAVYAWGFNSFGELGNNSTTQSNVPVAVYTSGALSGKTIVGITTGNFHSLVLTSDNALYAWGYNYYGQLGNNSTTDSSVPVAVYTSGDLSGKTIVGITTGYYHSLALTSDNAVYAWGYNFYGQLGINSTTASNVPVAVNTTNASSALKGKSVHLLGVGCGPYHSLALAGTAIPSVSSVTAPSDGSYTTGGNLDFTVNYSAAVTVDTSGGTPYIVLTVGSTARSASYTSGSGTTALVFRYTVQSGETDSNGIAVATSITLNGGTLKNTWSEDAATSFTAPTTTGVLVDTTAPSISSVTGPGDGSYTTGGNLDVTVNYDEAVTVNTSGGTPYIVLTVGASSKNATYQSGSGTTALVFRYTVQSGDTDSNGIAVATSITLNSGTHQRCRGQ